MLSFSDLGLGAVNKKTPEALYPPIEKLRVGTLSLNCSEQHYNGFFSKCLVGGRFLVFQVAQPHLGHFMTTPNLGRAQIARFFAVLAREPDDGEFGLGQTAG
jgi:hypothetical protein